jgi:hypothetical protein
VKYFVFHEDWYRTKKIRKLVLGYYAVLRSIKRSHPYMRCCLKKCQHCGIFFFTEFSNKIRNDLRCPFGCREAYRQQSSIQRSTAYYRTEEGRRKKKALNQKRYIRSRSEDNASEPASVPESENKSPVLEHLSAITSLIEGRKVSIEEIEDLLAQKGRQHSLPVEKKIMHAVFKRNKGPP